MATRTKVGVIGCGNISKAYLPAGKNFANLDVVACADLDPARAKAAAEAHDIPRACSVDELLATPEIEIVINLTIPKAHAEVDRAVLGAGKHVYGEKPLALSRPEGQSILSLAKSKGLRVGSAPDTFLGAGIQTCLKAVADGLIGEPVAATAFVTGHGHESWHPDPEFYYEKGGGPLFDMGPYYLTALIAFLGRARRVSASTKATFAERTITSQPKSGQKIQVEVPTHYAGVVDFDGGATATVLASFDMWRAKLPCIEIHGTDGSLSVPDPNGFAGEPMLFRAGDKDWKPLPFTHATNSRGLGVADMASAIATKRQHRASGDLAYHVLDIMCAFEESSAQGKHIEVKSPCERPATIPAGLEEGAID
jgi:predicted dehydrogenase